MEININTNERERMRGETEIEIEENCKKGPDKSTDKRRQQEKRYNMPLQYTNINTIDQQQQIGLLSINYDYYFIIILLLLPDHTQQQFTKDNGHPMIMENRGESEES